MKKLLVGLLIVALVVSVASALSCFPRSVRQDSIQESIPVGAAPEEGVVSGPGPAGTVCQAESQTIAQGFLLESPTFDFDGMEQTLELVAVNTMKCPLCWEFVFAFDCGHSGYGDRTGLVLLQMITPHIARTVIMEGNVVSAILDDEWDMMQQELISAGAGFPDSEVQCSP